MYLHHLLTRSENELIRKFYTAQKCKPSHNDWVKSIQNYLKDINLIITDEKISKISKYKF